MSNGAARAAVEAAAELVAAARAAKGTPWAQLAQLIDKPAIWTVAALQGQHELSREQAELVAEALGLDAAALAPLQRQPDRGALGTAVPTDPTVYRFYEALQVYGPALKALIREEFGDGIMSAINFRLDVRREPDPEGDRVVVTFDGKFLPYQW
jgi:cyanate lyase